MSLGSKVAEAIGTGRMGGRLWLYSNYHCNLACTYCLTESSPSSPSRELGRARMVAMAKLVTMVRWRSGAEGMARMPRMLGIPRVVRMVGRPRVAREC